MYLSKQEFKEEISPVVEAFVSGIIDVFYKVLEDEAKINKKTFAQPQERIMTAQQVCAYYGGFHNSTLRRHEANGLKRMSSLKNTNRMFKFSECERYFNSKKK